MWAAWGKQDASDCQAKGNCETAPEAGGGRGRGRPPERWAQGTAEPRPGDAAFAVPAGAAGPAGAQTALPLPCPVPALADVQHNSDPSGEEKLPHSSNSRDSCNALSEWSKTTRIDLLHNDSKTVNGHL